MEEKKKYRKTGFPWFIRYRENNLTGREKNDFERELQKDPFAMEAEEGLSTIPSDDIKKDMETLSKRLKYRTTGSRRIIIYRIAASVAVLLTVSAIYLLLNRSNEKGARQGAEPVAMVINKEGPVTANKADEKVKEISTPTPEKSIEKPTGGAQYVQKKETGYENQQKDKALKMDNRDSIDRKLVVVPQEIALADRAENISRAAPLAMSVIQNPEIREIKGKVLSSEGQLPIPGATITLKGTKIGTVTDANGDFKLAMQGKNDAILIASYTGMEEKEVAVTDDSMLRVNLKPSSIALNEVVVTGYNNKKADSRSIGATGGKAGINKEKTKYEYLPAEPAGGKENFDNYIQTNIRKPDILKSGSEAVVVLGFIVRYNGIPDSIKVVLSPGHQYSDEAIRLIKNGPKWKPATENGNPVEEEARVRIVFK
jgi:hypothetical protein